MTATRLEDREIELLLSGSQTESDDLAGLERFIAALSTEFEPPRDVTHMATSLAALAREGRSPRRTGLRRLATLAASGAMLIAFSGMALAADGSSPGDSLYGLDRALERIGIGSGGIDERIVEFDILLADGSENQAFTFLGEVIESGSDSDVEKAREHLELAATETSPSAAAAQEKVAALKTFIEENKGAGVGLDGKEFGQSVSEIARSKPKPDDTPGPSDETPADQGATGPPANAGPKNDKDPGPPDHAGPPGDTANQPPGDPVDEPGDSEDGAKDDPSPGPPDHAGPKDDKEPGPPDHAGPKDK